MVSKLTQLCPLFTPDHLTSSLLLIKDSVFQSGIPFILDFLNYTLKKPENSLIFIAVEHNFAHFLNNSKKAGLNIESSITTGQLLYIDYFNRLFDWIPKELPLTEEIPYTWKDFPKKLEIIEGFNEESINGMFEKMEDFMKNHENMKKWIILENLNYLMNASNFDSVKMSFMKTLMGFVEKGANIIVLGSVDDEIKGNLKLIDMLESLSWMTMEVMGNNSGFTKEIDGNVRYFDIF